MYRSALEEKAREMEVGDISAFLASNAFNGSGFSLEQASHTIVFAAV